MNALTIIPQVLPPAAVPAFSAPTENDWEFWLPRWISRKRATTQTVYRDEILRFLEFIGWKPIQFLSTLDIEAYQQKLVGSGEKPNTTCRKIATVCSLVSYIHRRNLQVCPQNVGAGVERVKASNELAGRILTEAEVIRMLDRTERPRDLALLRVLYSSGCRISEACGLCWKDVQWREHDCLITLHGKGGKIRTVGIYGEAVKALQAILPAGDLDPSTRVFRTCHGPLTRIYAVQIIRKAAKRANIRKPVSPHWFRHSSATHALNRKAPLPLVSQTLGHSNLATTGRYLHVAVDESMGKYHVL